MTTRKSVRQKYRELSRRTHAMLNVYLEAAFKSRAFELKAEADNYCIVKNILCAALEDARRQWAPPQHSTASKRQIKNIGLLTYPDYTSSR